MAAKEPRSTAETEKPTWKWAFLWSQASDVRYGHQMLDFEPGQKMLDGLRNGFRIEIKKGESTDSPFFFGRTVLGFDANKKSRARQRHARL
jgi:hypothetical protein